MELADVKVGETYLYTNPEDEVYNGRNVIVFLIEADGRGLPWPVQGAIMNSHGDMPEDLGSFDASELSPVV